MAVYTKLNKEILTIFLKNYTIGELIGFEGIQEGIENTNYKIFTSQDTYILTIFEKRVEEADLPFFIELKKHFIKKNFMCPNPVSDKKGKYIHQIKNKPCLISTFLQGKKANLVTTEHCKQLGEHLAIMHNNAYDFKLYRKNSLGQKHWKKIFDNFKNTQDNKYKFFFEDINTELNFLEKKWSSNLPSGVIHADVFQDNVFFIDDIFSGIIDFYFSCNDFYAYELAICLNAWCFDNNYIVDRNKSSAFLNAYQKIRTLSKDERLAFPILLRGAAMRIILTRIHDQIYHPEGAYVNPKDPLEYIKILKYHQNDNLINIDI